MKDFNITINLMVSGETIDEAKDNLIFILQNEDILNNMFIDVEFNE